MNSARDPHLCGEQPDGWKERVSISGSGPSRARRALSLSRWVQAGCREMLEAGGVPRVRDGDQEERAVPGGVQDVGTTSQGVWRAATPLQPSPAPEPSGGSRPWPTRGPRIL